MPSTATPTRRGSAITRSIASWRPERGAEGHLRTARRGYSFAARSPGLPGAPRRLGIPRARRRQWAFFLGEEHDSRPHALLGELRCCLEGEPRRAEAAMSRRSERRSRVSRPHDSVPPRESARMHAYPRCRDRSRHRESDLAASARREQERVVPKRFALACGCPVLGDSPTRASRGDASPRSPLRVRAGRSGAPRPGRMARPPRAAGSRSPDRARAARPRPGSPPECEGRPLPQRGDAPPAIGTRCRPARGHVIRPTRRRSSRAAGRYASRATVGNPSMIGSHAPNARMLSGSRMTRCRSWSSLPPSKTKTAWFPDR